MNALYVCVYVYAGSHHASSYIYGTYSRSTFNYDRIMHEEAEMVEMQNGCICCTLRGDLLKAVKKLSDEDKFDYLVIESTGIGEPLPVAQTFVMDVDSMEEKAPDLRQGEESKSALEVATDEKKSLFYYAKLDTLVTVVDSLNIYDVMSSIETLADKDNVSGMLGNTGATADSEGDVRDKYPGGREAMEEQRQTVIAASMGMPEDHLRKALKERGLQTTGTKEELVMQLVDALEGELLNNLAAQVDDRSIAKLWLDQIEFANVIVVSKAPQFLEKHGGKQNKLREIQEMLKKLNPDARIIVPSESMYGDLDIEASLINTGLFDMDEASNSANWVRELEEEEHNPERLEYGISSTTFENNEMPFHPERLHAVLSKFGDWFMSPQARSNKMDSPTFKGIVRTKGQVWLANSHAFPVFFQTSGQHVEIHPSEHPFVVEKKGTMSDVDAKAYEWMVENGWWSDEWGDHRTRLVFIGVDLDAKDIHNELNKALLTKEESAALGGHEGWKKLNDPFYNGKLVAKNESFYAYEAKKEALERQIGKLEEKSDD